MQSSRHRKRLHVAVIMDGNGRWAERRGLPRTAGHVAGAEALRRVVAAAPGAGVGTLTCYAFSSDNWKRPRAEVDALLRLFGERLEQEAPRLQAEDVRLSIIGRRDRLPKHLVERIRAAEAATADGECLHLRLAVDYSARDALLRAAAWASATASRQAFARALGAAYHADEAAPDVDLLVRTGGEQRLSDFLLWECAYAELLFLDTLWPDVTAADLARAVAAFHRRDRRFGAVVGAPLPVAAP